MNLNISIGLILLVVGLTILATVYRVSEAPDRIRLRLDTAKATCLKGGGEWVQVNRDSICQTSTAQK